MRQLNNAKMQRIFWNLVEQRRGYFLPTVRLAVKISNRTLNRRTGLNPEEAIQKIARGEKVAQKEPKARLTERKKAWSVGTKVRALKKGRTKGDDLSYKSYKADHFGAVTPITAVRFVGVYPKYKVGQRWVWGDEIIRARPEDTKAHELIIKRPVPIPGRGKKQKKIAKKRVKKSPKKQEFEIGDQVSVKTDGVWREGFYEGPADDSNYDHKIVWRQDGKRWVNEFKKNVVRPR